MVCSEIINLVTSLDLDSIEIKILTKAIYRYILKLDTPKDLRDVSTTYGVCKEVIAFKRQYLDISHYTLSRLWRSVFSIYLCKKECGRCLFMWNNLCHSEDACCETSRVGDVKKHYLCNFFKWDYKKVAHEFNVSLQDIMYILDNELVTCSDIPLLKQFENSLQIPDNLIIEKTIDKVINLIRFRVSKHLAFIYSYNNLDSEDFVEDIALCVRRGLVANDHITDEGKLIAIAKTIITQEVCNCINKYTTKKRGRLEKTDDGYRSKMLSLDSSMFQDPVIDGIYNHGITDSLIEHLRKNVNDEEREFIDINLGKHLPQGLIDRSFREYGKDFYSLRPRMAYRATLKYLDWDFKKVKSFKKKVEDILYTHKKEVSYV